MKERFVIALSRGIEKEQFQELQAKIDPNRIKLEFQILFQRELFDYVPASYNFSGRPARYAVVVLREGNDTSSVISAIVEDHPDAIHAAITTYIGDPARENIEGLTDLLMRWTEDRKITHVDPFRFAYGCRGSTVAANIPYVMAKIYTKSGRLLIKPEDLHEIAQDLEGF
ncbi:hypothetical protein KJ656_16380, partial [bacterium]|nr:hypothetical protein [bacterium]